MTIEQVLAQLNEPLNIETFAPHWDETVSSDDGLIPDFLRPEFVAWNRIASGLPDEATDPLQEAARRIGANPVLRLLAKHCYRLLYNHPDYNAFGQWPDFKAELGELGETFYLLILQASAPLIRAKHSAHGMPESITCATCSRYDAVQRFRVTHDGRWGAERRSLYWIRYHTAGKLFRIGRMEYKLEPYNGRVAAYRHKKSGRTLALAQDGACFDVHGHAVKTPETHQGETWLATLHTDGENVVGFPVAPLGMAVRRKISLPQRDWRLVLGKSDWTMDMHIPPGGNMTLEKCLESMREGTAFFQKYFADQPFASITCSSWIFNTQLEQILPPSANLVLFQHELYLYPIPSAGQDGLVFIFGRHDATPENSPRATSLQRAILDFMAAGNQWRGGGMFFLIEDLPVFGSQAYRAQWAKHYPDLVTDAVCG